MLNKHRSIGILTGVILLSHSTFSFAEDKWQISAGLGTALNLDQSIEIEMDEGEDIDSGTVGFDTKPFNTPPYYSFRVGKWSDQSAYEFEFIHHKIYAKSSDLDDRISNFEVTDGYNLLYGNYAVEYKPTWIVRFGVGVVVPHPDVTVDGVRSHGGYQLGGVTSQIAIEKEFPISDNFIFSLESKVTYSYAEIDLDYGKATVPNTAFHILGNIKYDIK